MAKPKLIYIEWADAVSKGGKFTDEEAEKWADNVDWIVRETGFLVKETKKYICIAQTRIDDEYDKYHVFEEVKKIPKTWIRKRRVIKYD